MRCISKAKNGKVEEDVARLFRCGKKCDGDSSILILAHIEPTCFSDCNSAVCTLIS